MRIKCLRSTTTRIAHGERGSGIHTYVLDPDHFTQIGAEGIGEVLQTLTSTIRWEGPSRTGLVELEIAPTPDLPADVIVVCVHGPGWVAIRVHADHATEAGCQALRRAVLARLRAWERRSYAASTLQVRPRVTWVLGLAASLLLVGTWGADSARDVLSNRTESLSPPITNNRNIAPPADLVVSTAPNLRKAQAVPASVVKVAGIPTSKVVGAGSVPDVGAAAAVVEIPAVVVAPPVTAPMVVAPPVAAAPVAPLTAAEQTALDASNAAALTARNAAAAADLTAANALAAANLTAATAAAAAEAVRLQAAADAWAVAHPNG